MKQLPSTRSEKIVVQKAGDETLVYDLNTNKAFCLNETSTIIFNACGNNQTFADLKREHKFSDDFIYFALDELKRNDLLQESYNSPFAAINRREVIRKVGLASMLALPVISSLIAPTSAIASSTCAGTNCYCDCSFGTPGCESGDVCTAPITISCPNPSCTCTIALVPGPDVCL